MTLKLLDFVAPTGSINKTLLQTTLTAQVFTRMLSNFSTNIFKFYTKMTVIRII